MSTTTVPIDAVVFDMDGLLLDTERLANEAWAAAAAELGRHIDPSVLVQCIGLDDTTTRSLIAAALGPEVDMPALARRRVALNDARVDREGMPLRPGAREIVAACVERGLPLAIATSSARQRTAWKLARAGLGDVFRHICTRDDVVDGKPAPDIYLLAAAKLGISPARCLVFEDSDHGVHAAHAAGMRVVMVPDQKPPTDAARAVAATVVFSLPEALAWCRSAALL